MIIVNERTQYAVGQGGFHAAKIGVWGYRDIRYVVDCGATKPYEKRRDECIDKYVDAEGKRELVDILFITHAHADHINGVEKLLDLNAGMRVDAIVMPLLSILERLLCFARTAAVDAGAANNSFYRDFVIDPVSAMARFEPGQIILVTRSKPDDDARPPDGIDQDSGPPELELWPEARYRDRPWKPVGVGDVEAYEPDILDGMRNPSNSTSPTTVIPDSVGFAYRHPQDTINWLLKPFVCPGVKAGTRAFLLALAKPKKLSVPKFLEWVSDRRNFKELITKDVKALVTAYETFGRNLNVTSLSVYSGPVRQVNREDRFGRTESLAYTPNWLAAMHRLGCRVGWLSTGDAALKEKKRRKAFLDHYGLLLQEVHTFVLPHHGSEGNFHEELLQVIKPTLCVAAADRMPNWRHPGTAVVQEVASSGAMLSVVTSAKASQLQEISTIAIRR